MGDGCLHGNETVTDGNYDTCMILETNVDSGVFLPLVPIAPHCITISGAVFLDFIITSNTQCSRIGNNGYVKADESVCGNSIRLIPCKLIDIWSEFTCRMRCQCKGDIPCQLWIQTLSEYNFNICEIIFVSTNN